MTNKLVVVGIDGSRSADSALRWAANEASRRDAQLLVVHAGMADGSAASLRTGDGTLVDQRPADYGHALIAKARATVFETDSACSVRSMIADEPAVRLLSDLGRGADLLVVGSHGLGQAGGALLGSVAYRVAAHAHCPVAVIGPDHRSESHGTTGGPNDPVAVGISGTAAGQAAWQWALREAELRHVPVLAVRSTHELSHTFTATPTDALSELLNLASQDFPTVKVLVEEREDAVEAVLLDAAIRSALFVLGCRYADRQGTSRLGPVASRLLHLSPRPIVVIGRPSEASERSCDDLSLALADQL